MPKLKTVEFNGKSYIEMENDRPVVIEDDGQETAFDVFHTRSTIARLNGESQKQREAREVAEARLRLYDGITDPEAARKAMETVQNFNDKKLIEAGEVEGLKSQWQKSQDERITGITKQHQDEIKKKDAAISKFKAEFINEKLGGAFKGSKFISDKIRAPRGMMQDTFGKYFQVEDDGRIVGHFPSGEKILSMERAGEPAEFDEALKQLVDKYPDRDSILQGSGSSGSGAQNGHTGSGGKRVISRAVYESMPAQDKIAVAMDLRQGKAEISA